MASPPDPATAAAPPGAAFGDSLGDSAFEPSALDRALERSTRLSLTLGNLGWRRLALLLVAALCGLLLLTRAVSLAPHLPGDWAPADDRLLLRAAGGSPLSAHEGQTLQRLHAPAGGTTLQADTLWLQPSTRWQTNDERRAAQQSAQQALTQALSQGAVELHFSPTGAAATAVALSPTGRGWVGMGAAYYALLLAALGLLVLAALTLLAQPQRHNALFALLCGLQALHLVLVALQTLPGLGKPAALLYWDGPLRVWLDLATAATLVQVIALHPRRLPTAPLVAAAAWALAGLAALALWRGLPGADWWWLQATLLLATGLAWWLIHRSARVEPNPYTALLRRLVAVALAGGALLSALLWWTPLPQSLAQARAVSTLWPLLLAGLLALLPLLVRAQPLLRELLLLSGLATLALAVQMALREAGLGPLAALSLALVFTLALYALARPWLRRRVLGSGPSTELIFEQLYRAAREVQARPERQTAVLARVLNELFEPLSLTPLDRSPSRTRVVGGGAALVVPVGSASAAASRVGEGRPATALSLRFARGGRRVFTLDDARLADRVVDQLQRAVAYDRAVERGRSEERQRIAQDLHDDIGARLLTLMYQAPDTEMEDYLRHTLQDLKTLTRGLAASEHRLSHAAAEWKADLTQRLTAAQVELGWSLLADRDLKLSVVQWSALTRVLRELASNTMAHGQATRLDVQFNLQRRQLLLVVSDDGQGRDPQSWSHGLGLGGVRKRVKLLGGTVQWREGQPRGIVCEVRVPDFGAARAESTRARA